MAAPMLALESGESRADPGLATFGALTLCVGLLVAFGALLGAWLSLRSGTAVWPPKDAALDNYVGTVLSLTVGMAAAAAEWGAYGVRKGERGQASAAYGLVLLLGLGFLNLLTYEVRLSHVSPGTSAFGAVYFAFHLVLGVSVVVALVAGLVAFARTLGGQVSAAQPALARSAAWIWHTVAVGWFVLYAAVYVVK